MRILTIQEIREIILDSGVSCDSELVEGWLKNGSLKNIKDGNQYLIQEHDLDDFVYDCQWNGSPYERNIDDAQKIERLLLEIRDLREENSKLQKEKMELELQLVIEPF